MNAALFLFLITAAVPEGLQMDDSVLMDKEVRFIGSHLPVEAEIGKNLSLDLYFATKTPLGGNDWIFLHIESTGNENCRMVHDRKAPKPIEGIIKYHVDLKISDECKPDRLEIFTGIYDRVTGGRLRLIESPSMDDRIHAAWINLVSSNPSDEERSIQPSEMRLQFYWSLLKPWKFWLLGILISFILLLLFRKFLKNPDDDPQVFGSVQDRQHMVRFSILALLIPLLLSIIAALDFIKDDAYISFRYAHNLVVGEGLVFNPGDRLEGFTNFLWTLILAIFEAMGADLFQVCEILGTLLAVIVILGTTHIIILFCGARTNMAYLWGGLWLATSSSFGLWSTSGMEQPLAMALPLVSLLLLWKIRSAPSIVPELATVTGQNSTDNKPTEVSSPNDQEEPGDEPTENKTEKESEKKVIQKEDKQSDRGNWLAWASGIIMGLGCMTRPEIHLIGIIAGLYLIIDLLRTRKLHPYTLRWVLGIFIIVLPFHAFRLWYYQSLFPNTFYVKTGSSTFLMIKGLKKLHEMFDFNNLGYLSVLAPFAFLNRRHLAEKLVVLAITLGFMFYIVKVGVDEMRWHRLFLPALPFLVILAAVGLRNLCCALSTLFRFKAAKYIFFIAGWALVTYQATDNFIFTYNEMGGFNGRGDLAGTYHPDLGKFITRHDNPGALVAFQDMGSTPYHAPDINFLDFIGLVDGTVARARYSYGLNAYTSTENYRNQNLYDEEMRDYFFERRPEWAILTVYIPKNKVQRIAELFSKNPAPESMLGTIANNGYQFGVYKDPRFKKNYVHVRTWKRSATYYLVLFRRTDLWNQIPGEVILDQAPSNLGGTNANFEHNIRLLGSEIENQSLERHEIFITTWWETPGPMEEDVIFFVHVNDKKSQTTFDHTPGDWMYPANRWRKGDILEDRVLFQIPSSMKPGVYDVYIGVYRRSTGQRFKVLKGNHDGSHRINLGKLTVTPLKPLIHHLVPPTDVEKQRKYPDRIIPSHLEQNRL